MEKRVGGQPLQSSWPHNFESTTLGQLSPFGSPRLRRTIHRTSGAGVSSRANAVGTSAPTSRRTSRAQSFDPEDGETTALVQPVDFVKDYGAADTSAHAHGGGTVGDSSFAQTVFNAINLLLGVGVLSLPFAFRMSGWAIGPALLALLTLLTNYTGKLIGKIMKMHPWVTGFPDMGEAAFGIKGRIAIACVFYVELLSACCMYLILMGDNLGKLFPNIPGIFLVLISAAVVLPTAWTSKMQWLSYFSILGVIASVFLMCVLLYQGVAPGTGASLFRPAETELHTEIDRWPLCFGLIMVGYAGHAVFPSIYLGMKEPQHFDKALDITYIVVTSVYGTIAFVGYIMYGIHTEQEVTLNLLNDAGPGSILPLIATWLIVVNPATKFALTLQPVSIGLEQLVLGKSVNNESTWNSCIKTLLRTGLTIMVTLIAISVPSFARVVSFIGALCSFCVSGFFPCLCYLKLAGPSLSRCTWWLNVCLAIMCFIFAIIGTLATFLANTS